MADVTESASLAERLVGGDKRALARAITLIESDDPAGWELVARGLSRAPEPPGSSVSPALPGSARAP